MMMSQRNQLSISLLKFICSSSAGPSFWRYCTCYPGLKVLISAWPLEPGYRPSYVVFICYYSYDIFTVLLLWMLDSPELFYSPVSSEDRNKQPWVRNVIFSSWVTVNIFFTSKNAQLSRCSLKGLQRFAHITQQWYPVQWSILMK